MFLHFALIFSRTMSNPQAGISRCSAKSPEQDTWWRPHKNSLPLHTGKAVPVVGAQPAGRSVFWVRSLPLHLAPNQPTRSQQAMDRQGGAYGKYFVYWLDKREPEVKLLWHSLNPEMLSEFLQKVFFVPPSSRRAVGYKGMAVPQMKIMGRCPSQQGREEERVPGRDWPWRFGLCSFSSSTELS